jgi:hypothetical protein
MTGCSLAFLPLGRPNPCYVQNGANCNRPGNAVSLVMCLIIKKPAGRQIQADFLRNAWQDNDHGWGYFYLHDRSLCWRRGMALGDLLSHNQALPADAEVYLHLRKATYGPVCPDLAHPLPVREGLLLMHNGSIEHLAPQCPQASDTQELAQALRNMLEGLSPAQVARMVRSQGFASLIAPLICGSMIVLLDTQGAVRLGRAWHQVEPQHWPAAMVGIEVSNTHTWRARSQACA